MASSTNRLRSIRLLVMDCDGVLTDGLLYYSSDGHESKAFHARDGYGIKQVLSVGVEIAVISGRQSPAVDRRLSELGVRHVYQGCRDKAAILKSLLSELDIAPEEVACIGDDLPDLPILEMAGLPIAVADAHPALDDKVQMKTQLPGGLGAVREVCDLILGARGHRDSQ